MQRWCKGRIPYASQPPEIKFRKGRRQERGKCRSGNIAPKRAGVYEMLRGVLCDLAHDLAKPGPGLALEDGFRFDAGAHKEIARQIKPALACVERHRAQ